MTTLSHLAQEGAYPADGYPKGGETLVRVSCGGMMHCKGLVMNSRPLTFGSERWHRYVPDKLEESCRVGKVYNLCRV